MSITAIILTKDEGIHLRRCLDSLSSVCDKICIVDSGSVDDTLDISREYGCDIYFNPWVSYAHQFNWALDNCLIDTPLTMRMDADEYLTDALIENIHQEILQGNDVYADAYQVKRRVVFMDRHIRWGGYYPIWLNRIWKTGKGRCEQRWMDEHMVVQGTTIRTLKGDLVDHNLNPVEWWLQKHIGYAKREAVDMIQIAIKDQSGSSDNHGNRQSKNKRIIKESIYSRLPLFVRPLLYFTIRYVFMLGFLDGKEGRIFHFNQALWYRMLVDTYIYKVQRLVSDTGVSYPTAVSSVLGYRIS